MAEHTRGPDDMPDRHAVRFGLRGKQDIIDCYVTWEALDQLEEGRAVSRNDRLNRFELHRPVIEAAALAKLGESDETITLDADDVLDQTGT